MRAFVALELPEEIKTKIEKIQQDLKKVGVQARWVKPEIAHLTLAFLGSITPNQVELIEKILNEVASQGESIKLSLFKIDCFPHPTKARIIFVDLRGELEKLNTLALKIRKGLKKDSIYFDKKPFVSHITLGRIKKKQNLTEVIKKIKIKKVGFIASEISLTKSQLTETGPIYKNLATAKLK